MQSRWRLREGARRQRGGPVSVVGEKDFVAYGRERKHGNREVFADAD